MATAPILRGASTAKIKAIDEIAKRSGPRPDDWKKPKYGDFDYWLAERCGWITEEELAADAEKYLAKRQRALETSHRFSEQRFTWAETPKYEEPITAGDYVPQISMKIVKDRNLTDSSRRIALFVLRHAYQDKRAERRIGMTVTFIMKGLSISRRTVQRSLTLLETRGYFHCEVAKGEASRMCIGLIIHLMQSLFPKHHQEKWPKKSKNPAASSMPHKQIQFFNSIEGAKQKISRMVWAIRCMNGVARQAFRDVPTCGNSRVGSCRGFQTVGGGSLHPALRTIDIG